MDRKSLRNAEAQWRSTRHVATQWPGDYAAKPLKQLSFFARLSAWLSAP
jgi:hypothetical protein